MAGDHALPGEPGVGPDVLIHPEGIHTVQAGRVRDPTLRLDADRGPRGMPGDTELVRQRRHGRVRVCEGVGGPPCRPSRQFGTRWSQFMILAERGGRARRVGAAPQAFGPDQPYRSPETGDVVQPHEPATVPDRDDPTRPAPLQYRVSLDTEGQDTTRLGDRRDMHALDAEQRIGTRAPRLGRAERSITHVRVSSARVASTLPIQEALTPSRPHATPNPRPPTRHART